MRLGRLAVICLLCALSVFAGAQIADIIKRAPECNPNLNAFPESSLVDFSKNLEAPAGKRGFVSVKDGHFYFADGQRARFFGINIAKNTLFIDKAQIDYLAALFARSGVNLVRIHHIDDTTGILDPDPKRMFRPERLDLVDYWVAKLKERGIYVAMDLNDYRTFLTVEGVVDGESLGRGAKPYAVFNQRLIELQQEFAKKLLVDHTNPYTGLSYANDPTVAMLEIYDENGLFIRRADWATLREPYKSALQKEWNEWLKGRYGATETLKAAWTDAHGNFALQPFETLEDGTVQLPRLDVNTSLQSTFKDPLLAPVRQSDGALFAYDMQVRYLKSMMDYLHTIGMKIPITAVGAQDIIPDLMATAAATDYIGINFYWDHPVWDNGKSWQPPYYFAMNNPIADNQSYSFPVTASLARMYNKPLVIRELGYCFPNLYRGVGMIEAAAYGAFLDIDAIFLFTYDALADLRTIGYFDIHLDPLRWGLVPYASRLFLSNAVQPAKYSVGIGYSQVDAFTWYQYQNPMYQLAFSTRVDNYFDMTKPHPFDLLVASGRSAGSYWLGDRLLLYANNRHTDLLYQNSVAGLDARQGYQIATGRSAELNFTFRGIGFDAGAVKPIQAWPVYSLEDMMARGYEPIATADTAAYGFKDNTAKVMGFRNLRSDLVPRFALDALHEWREAPLSHDQIDDDVLRSDTGQIVRDFNFRQMKVDTPQVQAIVGRIDGGRTQTTSMLKLTTTTPVGAIIAESLDGKSLDKSDRLLVKMTSRARNDATLLEAAPAGPKPFRLLSAGNAPIRTDGCCSDTPTRVELNGKLLLEVYMQNGTWEYLQEPDHALLYLDTGDITVTLPAKPKLVRWHTYTNIVDLSPGTAKVTVPAGVRYLEIIW